MEVLHARCAGIDVHKKQVKVCVRVARGDQVRREVREYGTATGELLAMADWLGTEGVTHVAMEATGPYWKPVWHVLEEGRYSRNLWIAPGGEGWMAGVKKAAYPSV
jgi:hypothetical protein